METFFDIECTLDIMSVTTLCCMVLTRLLSTGIETETNWYIDQNLVDQIEISRT